MPIDHAIRLEGPGAVIEDRAEVTACQGGLVVVVADGAGGIGNGAHAAETVLRRLGAFLAGGPNLDDEDTWTAFLEEADAAMSRDPDYGESTAVVLAVTEGLVCGASAGDSEAWFRPDGEGEDEGDGWVVLTSAQRRKPLLGSGEARPVGFSRPQRGGALVVGTDGLFKYTSPGKIRDRVAAGGAPGEICRALVDLVRLPNGTLQDDVGVVLCRVSP